MYDYLTMAGAVYFNGSLLHQDKSLVEPLTRAWNIPHYWLLSPPLLHVGENTLLIRVSDFAAFMPGLGSVRIGTPRVVEAAYDHEYFTRHDMQVFGLAISITVGCFFVVLWLLRTRESVYGWFAFMSLTWIIVGINQIVTTTWPFPSTNLWEAFNSAATLVFSGIFMIFINRFFKRKWASYETVFCIVILIGTTALFLTPISQMYMTRALNALICSVIMLGSCFYFLFMTLRQRETEQMLLSVYVLVVIAAVIHDTLTFLEIIHSNIYYANMASNFLLVGMALVLAWRFVSSLRRIENFNNELQLEVNTAKVDLANTLKRQYELEITHARIGERLNLVRDLHDGLGGTLVGGIAAIETASGEISRHYYIALLKEIRDDLRLIIETTALSSEEKVIFLNQLIPLRRRMTMMLEDNNIRCTWNIEGLDHLHLSTAQSLDLLRFIQEALTNVLKHSKASRVDVALGYDGKDVSLEIVDDGIGMTTTKSGGAGMSSMQARAKRLGTEMSIASKQGKTEIGLTMATLPT